MKANPLGTQILYLVIGLNKATRYTLEELSVKPGLTLCGSIIDSKQKNNCMEHIKFVEGITTMTDSIFNTPEAESEVAPQTCKRKREQKGEIFEKLYHAASLRICEMEEDIIVELEACYEEFRDMMAHQP